MSEIVGTGLSGQRASFTRAVGQKNAEGVVVGSAKLVAQSENVTDILYYASKLADFVRKAAEAGKDLNYEQRLELARKEWSRVKREENLPDDVIATQAIVAAVAKAIGKGRK